MVFEKSIKKKFSGNGEKIAKTMEQTQLSLTVYLLKHMRQLELRANSKLILMIIGERLKGKPLAYFK